MIILNTSEAGLLTYSDILFYLKRVNMMNIFKEEDVGFKNI